MDLTMHQDKSLPPVSDVLRYTRADGIVVEIKTSGELPLGPPPANTQPRNEPLELQLPLNGRKAKVQRHTQDTPQLQSMQPEKDPFMILDNPIIGGKVTVFVLLWGDFFNMHCACLSSLCTSIPTDRFNLRVGAVQLGDQSKALVQEWRDSGSIQHVYWHEDNPGKYRVMREMFYDDLAPIDTNWLIWLDDDTLCNRNRNWLPLLANKLVDGYDAGVRMAGPHQLWNFTPSQIATIRAAQNLEFVQGNKTHTVNWYRGRQFYDRHQRETPNGRTSHFATGSFWILHTQAMRECEIPDPRLQHNGGDYWIGEQLHQGGYKLAAFSNQKNLINWSSMPRRGKSEKHIGLL